MIIQCATPITDDRAGRIHVPNDPEESRALSPSLGQPPDKEVLDEPATTDPDGADIYQGFRAYPYTPAAD